MDLEDFRREYLRGGLRRKDLHDDPLEQFRAWMEQAVAANITDPTAMVVATVEPSPSPPQKAPWQRIVLLKDFGPEGFLFYTNSGSRKASAIKENPEVSLLFPWHVLDRQVIACGVAEQVPAEEAARYFAGRPRESQVASWASDQSQPLPGRDVLERNVADIESRFAGDEVPAPSAWVGYRVAPRQMEFWQGGAHRLHDRFLYTLGENGNWTVERLAP